MRHFKDWLTAYREYAKDDFCPEKFHLWAGIFVLAAALERKVWIHQESFCLYPNLYILLIARPGMGKSTAGNTAVNEFLKVLKGPEGEPRVLAMQSSEASFIGQMAGTRKFSVGTREYQHASSYLFASEASNSLKEMVGGGSIVGALTEFYDCPEFWKKKLVKEEIIVRNACCNVLACCTFSHLRELIPRNQIDGGFASRLIYVAHDEPLIRTPKLNPKSRDPEVRRKLLEDLIEIHHMTGPLIPDNEFMAAYEKWFPEHDAEVQSLKSERVQHFMARKHTNLLKLSMLCAVSEGSSSRLGLRHWEKAKELMKKIEASIPKILDHTIEKEKQAGIIYMILKSLEEGGGCLTGKDLMAKVIQRGIPLQSYELTLNSIHSGGLIRKEVMDRGIFRYTLLTNPEQYS